MAPFDPIHNLSLWLAYGLFLVIGMGFGAALELSGFGDSRKLAAQFYLKDMTVLKVMFTGIIVAATLLTLSSAFGLLDFDRLWVNPTYLWPGIVGGLVMGVGFVIGGFCPGTSLVASSTLKLDGILFASGVAFGIFVFGESVDSFQGFYQSSFMGRFMLTDLFGLPMGIVLTLLVLMALMMFYGAEISEQVFGQGKKLSEVSFVPSLRLKAVAAVVLGLALFATVLGQPTTQDRWERIAEAEQTKLENRDVYVHPGEVVELSQNATIRVTTLDVRSERDFNLFHLMCAKHVKKEQLTDPDYVRKLKGAPDNQVWFVMSNDEQEATEAYRTLRAQGLVNLYIIEGGVNKWLSIYPPDPCIATPFPKETKVEQESLRYAFSQSVGARSYSSHPGCPCKEFPTDCFLATHKDTHKRPTITRDESLPKLEYERKVKLKVKAKPQGGCG